MAISKYENFLPCLALRRWKMVFSSPSMMTVRSFMKINGICGDGIYVRKGNGALKTTTADKSKKKPINFLHSTYFISL